MIAELVGKSEANCRKLISRARGKMGISPDEPIHAEAASEEWVGRFLSALEQGNVDTVISLLGEDVVLVSDGGGKVSAAAHPIETRDHVVRFLLGVIRKARQDEEGLQVEIAQVNGQTGLVIRSEGGILTIVLLHVERNVIQNLYFVRNPDKLTLFHE
jgi:RNA polymerase sigma-70 factor (ECF subfamily)